MNAVYRQFWPIGMPLLFPLLKSALAILQWSWSSECHGDYDLGDDYKCLEMLKTQFSGYSVLMRPRYMAFNEGWMLEPAGPLAVSLNNHRFFNGHVDETEMQSSHLISVVDIRYVVLYL